MFLWLCSDSRNHWVFRFPFAFDSRSVRFFSVLILFYWINNNNNNNNNKMNNILDARSYFSAPVRSTSEYFDGTSRFNLWGGNLLNNAPFCRDMTWTKVDSNVFFIFNLIKNVGMLRYYSSWIIQLLQKVVKLHRLKLSPKRFDLLILSTNQAVNVAPISPFISVILFILRVQANKWHFFKIRK